MTTPDPSDETAESPGYDRIKGKFKIGDGPDQRATITVEKVRPADDETLDDLQEDYAAELEQTLEHARAELGLTESDD